MKACPKCGRGLFGPKMGFYFCSGCKRIPKFCDCKLRDLDSKVRDIVARWQDRELDAEDAMLELQEVIEK